METVTLTRTIEAAPETITAAMDDLESFMLAAGFDEVAVDGEELRVVNAVGIAEIELLLELLDDADAPLAYEQREGIFEEMVTSYAVETAEDGTEGGAVDSEETEVTARTEFAMDVAIVGSVLDATVIKRQRRRELSTQLDWLEATATGSDS